MEIKLLWNSVHMPSFLIMEVQLNTIPQNYNIHTRCILNTDTAL